MRMGIRHTNPKDHAMPHYRIRWKGPYDAQDRPVRVLTLVAESKEHAAKLHDKLFPARERRVVAYRKSR